MKDMERVKLDKEEVYNAILSTKTTKELIKTIGHSRDKVIDFIKHNDLYKIYCEHYKIPYKENYLIPCCICGSTNQVSCLKNKMYCKKHYNHIYRYDKIINKTIYDKNDIEYDYNNNIAYIIIRDKYQNINGKAIIDIDDVDNISRYKWYLSYGYPVTKGVDKNNNIDIANVIFNNYDNMYDHIDNNRLNNRKSNLRPVSSHQNAMNMGKKNTNTSGVTGVSSKKVKGGIKWYSVITYNYESIWLGCYNTFDEAVVARLKGEAKYFKNYAPNYNVESNTIKLTYTSKTDFKVRTIEVNLEGDII